MIRDIAVAESSTEPGVLVVHRADCPTVRLLANSGYRVMTLLDCERPPPADLPWHECMDETDS